LQTTPIRAGTLTRLLQRHSYFRDVAVEEFAHAVAHEVAVNESEPVPILKAGEASPYAWFLVAGSVTLEQEGQSSRVLHAADADAGFPIANLRPSRYTVRADLEAKLVRLEQSFVKRLAQKPKPVRFLGGSEVGGGSWQSHRFAIEVERIRKSGEFRVPALPGVSARITQVMQQPDFDIKDISKLISVDPAIAGGLVSMANSALFRGRDPVDTLQAAIVRLGLQQTQTLVMTLATKALFAAKSTWLRKRLNQIWRHAVDVAAYATVLADLCPRLDNSKALLLGLLHEIGAVPLVELADRFPELEQTPGILAAVLANMAPHLTIMTLDKWGLHEFSTAALHQENWYYSHDGDVDYTDVLVVAHLHGLIKARRFKDLPRIDETPAYQHLMKLGLTASKSVDVLEDASQQIAELRTLLG
jgi:HD-like signal output (HDOD) protein